MIQHLMGKDNGTDDKANTCQHVGNAGLLFYFREVWQLILSLKTEIVLNCVYLHKLPKVKYIQVDPFGEVLEFLRCE